MNLILFSKINSVSTLFINDNNNYISDSDNIGTLKVVGTGFKHVLVQAEDNQFYLSHDINGNKSNIGSVYLDYRNKLHDRKLLIYGHNSKTIEEAPFHFLENYLDYEFGQKYNKLVLETVDGDFYYQLFTVMIVNNDFQHINLNWSSDGYKKHLDWFLDNSIFDYLVDVNINDQIIIFQTCFYEPKNSYLLVGWKKMT